MNERKEKPLQPPEENSSETSFGKRPFSELVRERLNWLVTVWKVSLPLYVGLKSCATMYQLGVSPQEARIISSVLAAAVGTAIFNPPSKSSIMNRFKRGM